MEKGFTLIELLIVIAIIGILVAAITPRYVSFTADAKVAATKANLSSLRGALTLYAGKDSNGEYPAALGTLDGANACGTGEQCIEKIPANKVVDSSADSCPDGDIGANCTNTEMHWAYSSGSINACDGAGSAYAW